MNKPLLIEGFAITQVLAAVTGITNGTFQKGRGSVQWVDLVPTVDYINTNYSRVTLQVGGQDIFKDEPLSAFDFRQHPAVYRPTPGIFSEAQTWALRTNNSLNALAVTSRLHAYYGLDPRLFGELRRSLLGLRRQFFGLNAVGAGATVEQSFTIPIDNGCVAAIEILDDSKVLADTLLSTITVTVDGVQIIKNASLALGHYLCGRPNLIMPVVIDEGATITISITNGGTAAVYAGVRLYFAGVNGN